MPARLAYTALVLQAATAYASLGSLRRPARRSYRVRRLASATPATDAILQTTVGAYVAQTLQPKLVSLGARSTRLILRGGEWWRLATPAFLHGSPTHLLVNVMALRNVGTVLERAYGAKRTALVYGLSAVGGNALAVLVEGAGSRVVSVGASGAVAGLVGALAIHLWRHPNLYAAGGLKSIRDTVLLNAALGMTSGTTDNLAHLGGLVTGAAAGLAFGTRWVPVPGRRNTYADRPLVRLPF